MAGQTIALAFGKIFGAVASIALVRYLGAEKQGIYSYVISLVYLLSFISDFGMANMLTREIRSAGKNAGKILGNSILIQLFQIFISVVILVLIAFIAEKDPYIRKNLLAATGAMLILYLSGPFTSALNSYEKMFISGILSAIGSIINAAFIFAAIWLKAELTFIIIMIGLSNVLQVALAWIFCVKFAVKPSFEPDLSAVKKLFLLCLPFAVISLFTYLLSRIDVMLLFNLKGAEEAGYYTAVTRITDILTMFVVMIMSPVYPRLSYLNEAEGREKVLKTINLTVKYISYACAPFVLVISIFPAFFSDLILGKEFARSAPALSVIIWSIYILTLRVIPEYALNSARRTFTVAGGFLTALAVNFIMNILFIPKFGFMASVWANLAGNITLLVFFYFSVKKNFGTPAFIRFILITAAGLAGAYFAGTFAASYTVYAGIAAAFASYAAVTFLLSFFTKQDFEYFRSVLKK